MPIKLHNGDYALTPHGHFIQATPTQEILQRAYTCLRVKKGSFPNNKELGSELFTLDLAVCTEETLKIYISEALANITEVEVIDIKRHNNKADNAPSLTVYLRIKNQIEQLEV